MPRDITEINDPRLVKALAHPIRIQVLRAIQDGHSTPNDIARAIEQPLPNVSYHVRILAKLEVIELVEVTQVRGAAQHHYRPVGQIRITDRAWAEVPRDVQTQIAANTVATISEGARDAVLNGGFAREDAILVRYPMILDAQGFADMSAAATEFLDTANRIAKAVSKRLAANPDPDAVIKSTAVVMHFTSQEEQNP